MIYNSVMYVTVWWVACAAKSGGSKYTHLYFVICLYNVGQDSLSLVSFPTSLIKVVLIFHSLALNRYSSAFLCEKDLIM